MDLRCSCSGSLLIPAEIKNILAVPTFYFDNGSIMLECKYSSIMVENSVLIFQESKKDVKVTCSRCGSIYTLPQDLIKLKVSDSRSSAMYLDAFILIIDGAIYRVGELKTLEEIYNQAKIVCKSSSLVKVSDLTFTWRM